MCIQLRQRPLHAVADFVPPSPPKKRPEFVPPDMSQLDLFHRRARVDPFRLPPPDLVDDACGLIRGWGTWRCVYSTTDIEIHSDSVKHFPLGLLSFNVRDGAPRRAIGTSPAYTPPPLPVFSVSRHPTRTLAPLAHSSLSTLPYGSQVASTISTFNTMSIDKHSDLYSNLFVSSR